MFAGDTLTQPIDALLGQGNSGRSQEEAPSPTGACPSTSPACSRACRVSTQVADASHRADYLEFSAFAARADISPCASSSGGSVRGAVQRGGGGSCTPRTLSRFPRHDSPKPPSAARFRPATAEPCPAASKGRLAASVGTYLPRPNSVLGSVRAQTNSGRYVGRIQNKNLQKLRYTGDGDKGADVLRAATSITVDQRYELAS